MMHKISHRSQKLNQEMKRRIAKAIPEAIGFDDKLSRAHIYVTAVKVSPDMRSAKVMITSFKNDIDILKALTALRVPIQNCIKKNSRMKFTPKLFFVIDKGMKESLEVYDVIEKEMALS